MRILKLAILFWEAQSTTKREILYAKAKNENFLFVSSDQRLGKLLCPESWHFTENPIRPWKAMSDNVLNSLGENAWPHHLACGLVPAGPNGSGLA
jgi:hypothetical protein